VTLAQLLDQLGVREELIAGDMDDLRHGTRDQVKVAACRIFRSLRRLCSTDHEISRNECVTEFPTARLDALRTLLTEVLK
jgi:hypothetical protein